MDDAENLKDPPMELLDHNFIREVYEVLLPVNSTYPYASFYPRGDMGPRRLIAVQMGRAAYEAFAEEYTKNPIYFLGYVARVWAEGIKDGRQENDWLSMDWGRETEMQYLAKYNRHLANAFYNKQKNHEDRKKQFAAAFCNANILWWHADHLPYNNYGRNEENE